MLYLYNRRSDQLSQYIKVAFFVVFMIVRHLQRKAIRMCVEVLCDMCYLLKILEMIILCRFCVIVKYNVNIEYTAEQQM